MENSISLKWNKFQSCAANSFKQLRKFHEFDDVTLVCDDYSQMSAHKLILSSCSTYFKTILSQTNHPNPMICFDGISSQELNNILDYIYNGEVLIGQDDMDQFLKIAARLKLEGLSGSSALVMNNEALVTDNEKPSVSNEYECIEQEDYQEINHILSSKIRKPLNVDLKKGKKNIISSQKFDSGKDNNEEKNKKHGNLFMNMNNLEEDKSSISNEYDECIPQEDEGDQDIRQVKPYERRSKDISIVALKEEYEDNTSVSNEVEFRVKKDDEDLERKHMMPSRRKGGKNKRIIFSSQKLFSLEDINEEIHKYMSSIMDNGRTKYVCEICTKLLNDIGKAREHVEVHFEGIELTCDTCDQLFGGRATLRRHNCSIK